MRNVVGWVKIRVWFWTWLLDIKVIHGYMEEAAAQKGGLGWRRQWEMSGRGH